MVDEHDTRVLFIAPSSEKMELETVDNIVHGFHPMEQ